MSDFSLQHGYLELFKLPNKLGTISTFKRIPLTEEEAMFLLKALKLYNNENSTDEELLKKLKNNDIN